LVFILRIAVVGLDGVGLDAFRLFKPYMENLHKLFRMGKYAVIDTMPPYTPPIWTSISTGVNPGKHGIMSFTIPVIKNGFVENKPLTSRDICVPRIWEFLGFLKRKSIIYNYPLMYPLKTQLLLNTIQITGWDSPRREYYPLKLRDAINKYFPEEPHRWHDVFKYRDRRVFVKNYLERVYRVLKLKIKGLKKIINTYEHDLFMFIISETDWIQHLVVRYKDSFDEYPILADILREIDDFIEYLVTNGKYDYIFITSDHDHKTFTKIKNVYYPLLKRGLFNIMGKNSSITKLLNKGFSKNAIKYFSSISIGFRALNRVLKILGAKYMFPYITPTDENVGLYVFKGDPRSVAKIYEEELGLKPYLREQLYSGECLYKLPHIVFDYRLFKGDIYIGRSTIYKPIIKLSPRRDHMYGGLFILINNSEKYTGLTLERSIVKPWDIGATIHYLLTGIIPDNFDGNVVVKPLVNDEPRRVRLLRKILLARKIYGLKMK
jgi:hypothetical protein